MATSHFTGDFARLVPHNHVAQLLFSRTAVYVQNNDTFHLQFVDRTDSESDPASTEPVEDSTEYDTYSETDAEDSRVKSMQHGHFILSLDKNRAPELPHIGWRVGKGSSKALTNRGVEFLLAKPGDRLSKPLANVHMVFRFNLKSGFLMLKAGSNKSGVEFNTGGTWAKLEYPEEQLMHQPATMLRVGACEYELKYVVEPKNREVFFEQRTVFLDNLLPEGYSLQLVFHKLPGDNHVLRGKYLEFETKGSGAFGWINRGVDTKTDPVAIKEIRINRPGDLQEVMEEVRMGKLFTNKRGLLPILDAWCEHKCFGGCPKTMEKFFIFMPYAASDFCVKFWHKSSIPRTAKLHLLREPLEGIRTLHEMGIMHRDIRPKNMLIISIKPPRASLCDYGKAIEASSDTCTAIGPISTLAPELWTIRRDGPYTNKIDLWAYGYAIAEILGYSIAKYPGSAGLHSNNPPIDQHRHSAIFEMLRNHRDIFSEDGPLVDLTLKLLALKPKERLSASQALEHECWNPILTQEHEEGPESSTKRAKHTQDDDAERAPNEMTSPLTIKTQKLPSDVLRNYLNHK